MNTQDEHKTRKLTNILQLQLETRSVLDHCHNHLLPNAR